MRTNKQQPSACSTLPIPTGRRGGPGKARPESHPSPGPCWFCYCHAVELFLKAFLRAHGISARDLRQRLRTSIRRLAEEAKKKGLPLDPDSARRSCDGHLGHDAPQSASARSRGQGSMPWSARATTSTGDGTMMISQGYKVRKSLGIDAGWPSSGLPGRSRSCHRRSRLSEDWRSSQRSIGAQGRPNGPGTRARAVPPVEAGDLVRLCLRHGPEEAWTLTAPSVATS